MSWGERSRAMRGGLPLILALALAACSSGEREAAPAPRSASPPAAHDSSQAAPTPARRPVPPYYESAAAAKPLPRLVSPEYFRDFPVVERVYRITHGIPEVLAQQPCYCWCDKFGHGSLLDCFASDHGAG